VPLPEPYLLGIAAGAWLQRMRPWVLPAPRYVHRIVGWPLVAAGAHLALWSWRAAWQVDLEHPDRLVTSGPYEVSRNPMYVGWALLHLGTGLVRGSGWIVAAFPAAAAQVHREVLREERALGETFAADFGAYRAAVPRYLAWRRLSRSVPRP
jgi:protein-S-isoprenylcysteine O-methyltransferase Ste14